MSKVNALYVEMASEAFLYTQVVVKLPYYAQYRLDNRGFQIDFWTTKYQETGITVPKVLLLICPFAVYSRCPLYNKYIYIILLYPYFELNPESASSTSKQASVPLLLYDAEQDQLNMIVSVSHTKEVK